MAQDKFGLELSDINLYDGKETTSSSLADTGLVDVKGGVVVDTDSSEAGKMYLDVNGESKTSQIDTLGHEVLETQGFQGKGQGIFFSNSESTQEALGDAFGTNWLIASTKPRVVIYIAPEAVTSTNDKWPVTAFIKAH